MTSFTVLHGKSNPEMTDAAKLTVKIQFHGKVLGCILFDFEDIGMAIIAVKPDNMLLVRKDCRRIAAPFGIEDQFFVEGDIVRGLDFQIAVRFDQTFFERTAPVPAIAERRFRKGCKELGKFIVAVVEVVIMALLAVSLAVTEHHHIVMAGTAEFSRAIRLFGDLRRISLHGELQLEMADATGVLSAVDPVREHDRFDIVLRGRPVQQERAVLVCRRLRRKFPLPPGGRGNNDQQTDDGEKHFY